MPDQDESGGAPARYRNGYFAGGSGTAKARPRRPTAAGVVTNLLSGTESAVEFPSSEAEFEEPAEFPPAGSPQEEIVSLRRTIDQKDQAILRSVMTLQDLQQQLAEEKDESQNLRGALIALNREDPAATSGDTPPSEPAPGPAHGADGRPTFPPELQAELDKQRKEWAKIQRSLERQHGQRQSELSSVRSQWFQTQQQLETESRARRMESAQASATISKLTRDLGSAREEVVSSGLVRHGWSKGAWVMVLASVCVTILFGVGLTWTQVSAHSTPPIAGSESATGTIPGSQGSPTELLRAAKQTPVDTRPISVPAVSTGSAGAFQGSLSRLNQSLSGFGNRRVEDVLREVRTRSGDPTVCSFQWNNGQPALLYGGASLKVNLSTELTRCAMAVDQAHKK
jgi:hypothetical protein